MKNIFCLLFCALSTLAFAQETQKHKVEWGFILGIETQSLGIQTFGEKSPEETTVFADGSYPGGTIGVSGRKLLWRGLAFESGLSLSSTRNKVSFWPYNRSQYNFTDLELPVYFSVTNQKKGDRAIRGKVLFGPRFGWNLASGGDERLQFYRERLGLDLGLGVEIDLGKWKLCPEAIYSHGLNNMHNFKGSDFDFLVGRAVRDKVAFRVVVQQSR